MWREGKEEEEERGRQEEEGGRMMTARLGLGYGYSSFSCFLFRLHF